MFHAGKIRASSLVELMITVTIFSIFATMSIGAVSNIMGSTKRVQAQVFLYTEAQTLMDQLGRVVEQNTIDYETYYSRMVQEETGWHTENYGYYGQAFYDPGSDGPYDGPYVGVDGYGIFCLDGVSVYPDDCPEETPDQSQGDLDTGLHYFDGTDDDMNAMCEDANCEDYDYFFTDELILVNNAGNERAVFVRELFNDSEVDYFMSKIQLTGSDTDNDGISDLWVCVDGYECESELGPNGEHFPDELDLTMDDDPQVDFIPITPSTISIEEFWIVLAPNEDPYRAFAEEDILIQPQVKIIMTVELSENYGSRIIGNPLSITLQKTVSTGVYSEITSYE